MSNRITFNGLSSGIDTESVVKAMMMTYQSKVDNEKADKVLLEWKKEAYQSINTKVLNFHQNFISPSRLIGTFNQKTVTSSDTGLVQINDGSTVPEGNHTLKVMQLAEAARLETSKIKQYKDKDGNLVDPTDDTTLQELGISDFEFEVEMNGEKTTVKIETTYEGKDADGNPITKQKTLSQLESELKKQLPDMNINFDEGAGAFFVSSKKSGADGSFTITATSGDTTALSKLGILGDKETTKAVDGQNASVEYNGIIVESSSNQLSVNGLNINLVSADPSKEVTIVSTQDKEQIVEFVTDMVDAYNELIEEINELTGERKSREYGPLTDEQKEGMTEEEIKLWEEKAKEGLLSKDPVLEQFTNNMRSILGGILGDGTSEFRMLSDIGITTGNWQEQGKLHIDEDKLRKAIETDADAIVKMFTAQMEVDEKGEPIKGTGGFGAQMFDMTSEMFARTDDKSSNFLFNDKVLLEQIREAEEAIDKAQDLYDRMEESYYARFAAMEAMMAQYNSQSAAIMGMA